MLKIVRNCVEKNEDKCRKLRRANPIIADMLRADGAKTAMWTMGWIEEGDFVVLPADIALSEQMVCDIESAIVKLE